MKINKAIDTGLDNVLNNGLSININVPMETQLSMAVITLITGALIIMFRIAAVKHM